MIFYVFVIISLSIFETFIFYGFISHFYVLFSKVLIFNIFAGLRTLHDAGPELKRAISGNLDDMRDDDIPTHRVSGLCIVNEK